MAGILGKLRLTVEVLEARDLPSVTLTPGSLNQKTLNHGNGAFTVRVLSDTEAGTNLLSSGSALTFNVVDSTNTSTTLAAPFKTIRKDFNHDGVMDVQLKFRRSVLAGLAAGDYQIQAANADASLSDAGTFSVFVPGHRH